MALYTRKGDSGTTSLWDGTRVSKSDVRIKLNGALDETSAVLGLARTIRKDTRIEDIQRLLSDFMAYVARGNKNITPPDPRQLEIWIDETSKRYPASGEFALPGKSYLGAVFHMARTVARRAERESLAPGEIEPQAAAWLNRLSDLLFAMAQEADFEETIKNVTMQVKLALEKLEVEIMENFKLDKAREIIGAMRTKAAAIGVPMVMAVCDAAGDIVAMERMDGALPISISLAPNKARTAARIRMSTEDLGKASQPGQPLYGIHNDPDVVIFGGGIPLKKDGEVIGAVGVSGGSVEEDISVAKAGVSVN